MCRSEAKGKSFPPKPRDFGILSREEEFPMKWRIDVLYARALYIVIVLASLVAAAAAGYKWR
jgi:hypothetical protein